MLSNVKIVAYFCHTLFKAVDELYFCLDAVVVPEIFLFNFTVAFLSCLIYSGKEHYMSTTLLSAECCVCRYYCDIICTDLFVL